jgi:hypothetical protein
MKKMFAGILLIIMSATLVSAMADDAKNATKSAKPAVKATAKAQKFDGWVSDEKCGAKIDGDCARKCAGAGVKVVFVDTDKNIIPVTNSETLKNFAGQHVNVKGKLENGALTVESVKAAPVTASKL